MTIITDHAALKWLLNSTSECANRRLERWKITLSEYEYDIEYRKGTKHSNTDAFSRLTQNRITFMLITSKIIVIMDNQLYKELTHYLNTLTYLNGLTNQQKIHI